ncbi:hypothetical protein DPEC_G00306030 [Dallia pectoralis]|uniref:Uncharacterized protein n=1 Tax=Dallia pectoralis TaxID=75939 RepID=A0ACC2FE56_DALPE|nr:hypothetical protein DPEC_G00306030 [Dallia pectoralis]
MVTNVSLWPTTTVKCLDAFVWQYGLYSAQSGGFIPSVFCTRGEVACSCQLNPPSHQFFGLDYQAFITAIRSWDKVLS